MTDGYPTMLKIRNLHASVGNRPILKGVNLEVPYMQSGKAILATDIRSHTQVLDRECAELVAPEPAALASGLERLARDEGLRGRLGAEARTRARRDYSRAAYRERLQRAYSRLLGG